MVAWLNVGSGFCNTPASGEQRKQRLCMLLCSSRVEADDTVLPYPDDPNKWYESVVHLVGNRRKHTSRHV